MTTHMIDRRLIERRQHSRRQSLRDHGIVAARIRPGHAVSIIDVSAGGALVETQYRLLPGTSVELHINLQAGGVVVRGRVLRSAVVGLRSDSIRYRGAVCFYQRVALPVEAPQPAADLPMESSEGRLSL